MRIESMAELLAEWRVLISTGATMRGAYESVKAGIVPETRSRPERLFLCRRFKKRNIFPGRCTLFPELRCIQGVLKKQGSL
ncbi:MAG: hypothetical protein ACLTLQ_21110 [[Clostridium] scindens]